ncbi:hypothetical protein BJX66DRAFT_315089 [Aspergillus keveii]|uniref:Beta-glucuronidase C-terminal domain-containing protein n=1 Tax=Aspergillus keveii TaxID=714993 RepID=A0ABR4FPZ1_9EURO
MRLAVSHVAIAVLCAVSTTQAESTTFTVPKSGKPGAQPLDDAPISFSFPFAGLPGYFPGMPLAHKCLETFKEVTGTWPRIRIGGTSEDYGTFDPDLDVPNIITGTAPTGQGITTFGPLLMRLVAGYKGSIVWGLNRGSNNISNTIAAAKAAVKEIPSLYALELGNEPDVFGALGRPIAPSLVDWTPQADAESESEWQTDIGQALNKKHIFQAGSYYRSPPTGWSAKSYFQYANASADKYIKVYSQHHYPQSALSQDEDPPNVEALMSHINVTRKVSMYAEDVKVARERGFDYVFGETNSVSGNGSPGQGATFATGLWVLDYALRAASIGVKRLYFHQGTVGKSYYVWFKEGNIMSPFYGGYVAAEAMAGGSPIAALDDGSTNYAGYAIYGRSGAVKRIVLINTDFFDGNGTRSTREFVLEGLKVKEGGSVRMRRLTAPSSLSQQDLGEMPTFAGRVVDDETCRFTGKEVVEKVQVAGGKAVFVLAASEAVVIALDG